MRTSLGPRDTKGQTKSWPPPPWISPTVSGEATLRTAPSPRPITGSAAGGSSPEPVVLGAELSRTRCERNDGLRAGRDRWVGPSDDPRTDPAVPDERCAQRCEELDAVGEPSLEVGPDGIACRAVPNRKKSDPSRSSFGPTGPTLLKRGAP